MKRNQWPPASQCVSGLFFEILKKYAEEKKLILEEAKHLAPNSQMPFEEFHALFVRVAHQSGDVNFGLHLAERFHTALSGGVLAGLQANSPNIGQAIERLCRYHHLMGDYIQLRFDRNACRGALYCEWTKKGLKLDRQIIEGILCNIALGLRRLTNGELRFAEVRFSHSRPQDFGEHERLFECRCVFGQPVNAMVLKAEELKRPIFLADLTLLHNLERIAQKTLKELSLGEWTRQVSQIIHGRLLSGESCALSDVAAELAVSRRLLQFNLKDERISFRQLLDQVRKNMALAYLENSAMSLCDIAFILGFTDQSAFNHAFKRWTGVHPGKYRR